jgi:hypothetical protein
MLGDVAHDGAKILARQPVAGNLSMQRGNRAGRFGLAHGGRVSVGDAELGKRVLRQTEFVTADDVGVVHHVQRGENHAPVGTHLDLGQRLKTLGAINRAVAVQVDDVFTPGVDRDAAQGEFGRVIVAGRGGRAGRRFAVHSLSGAFARRPMAIGRRSCACTDYPTNRAAASALA